MVEATYYERADGDLKQQYDLANQQMQLGRLDQAVDRLSRIISQEPGFAPAYNKLGVAEIARGDRSAAEHWFERALEVDGRYAPALANLGNLALERREYGTAHELYVQALDADGECGSAHQNLAVVLQHQGRHHEAVRHLRIARRRMRRPTGYYITARSRIEHHNRWYLIGVIVAVIFGFIYWVSRW